MLFKCASSFSVTLTLSMASADPESFYEQNINDIDNAKLIKLTLALDRYSELYNKCKIWTGPVNKGGYGIYRHSHKGRRLNLKVHRLMYYIHNGEPIPRDRHVSHRCHVRNCITPDHLSLEPQKVNNSRMICKNEGLCTGHHGHPDCLFLE